MFLGPADSIANTGYNGKIGINIETPTSKLTVNGDVEVVNSAKGFILRDENNVRWRISVNTDGSLSVVNV